MRHVTAKGTVHERGPCSLLVCANGLAARVWKRRDGRWTFGCPPDYDSACAYPTALAAYRAARRVIG